MEVLIGEVAFCSIYSLSETSVFDEFVDKLKCQDKVNVSLIIHLLATSICQLFKFAFF